MGLIGQIGGQNLEDQFNKATPDLNGQNISTGVQSISNPASAVGNIGARLGNEAAESEKVVDTVIEQGTKTVLPTGLDTVGKSIVEIGTNQDGTKEDIQDIVNNPQETVDNVRENVPKWEDIAGGFDRLGGKADESIGRQFDNTPGGGIFDEAGNLVMPDIKQFLTGFSLTAIAFVGATLLGLKYLADIRTGGNK